VEILQSTHALPSIKAQRGFFLVVFIFKLAGASQSATVLLSYQNCGGGKRSVRAGKNAELCIPARRNNKEFAYSLDWLQKWGRITLRCSRYLFKWEKANFSQSLPRFSQAEIIISAFKCGKFDFQSCAPARILRS
jgi:hypothetical protein